MDSKEPPTPPPQYTGSSKDQPDPHYDDPYIGRSSRTRPSRFEHLILRPWIVFGITILMAFLGIGVEIALLLSREKNGFPVPKKNIFTFASTSFLTSFFPTLLMVPLAFAWSEADFALRSLQPYVVLAEGNARAEDSLLLDYVRIHFLLMPCITLTNSARLQMALATGFLQPLAGSVISVKQKSFTTDIEVESRTSIGLAPDFSTLNAFLAAAGVGVPFVHIQATAETDTFSNHPQFTEAAAFQDLPDPPFVQAGWAAAEFKLPTNPGLNATIAVNTTGVRTSANCNIPSTTTLRPTENSTFEAIFSASGSLAGGYGDGCSTNISFNPATADRQYGVATADPTSCGMPASTPEQFLPVVFWFFLDNNGTGELPDVKGVICKPSLEVFRAEIRVNLADRSLVDVQIMENYPNPNNVSGEPLNGQGFNAVVLDDLAGNDQFVQARATSIRTGIPGAIFRFASQGDLQSEFRSKDGFLNLTQQIYTQHLSVSAKSIYFIPSSDVLPAKKTELIERLIVDPLAAHLLAVLLLSLTVFGTAIHMMHLRIRRRMRLHLASKPGTIASAVALTTSSQLGHKANLDPWDTRLDLKQKLAGMKFGFDAYGNVVIEGEQGVMNVPRTPRSPGMFGEKASLLEKGKEDYDEGTSRPATPLPSTQVLEVHEEALVNPHGSFVSPLDAFVNPHDDIRA